MPIPEFTLHLGSLKCQLIQRKIQYEFSGEVEKRVLTFPLQCLNLPECLHVLVSVQAHSLNTLQAKTTMKTIKR